MTLRPLLICLALAPLAACQPPPDPDAAIAALKADQAKWQEDIRRHDAKAYAAHYASDGVLYDAGQAPVPGPVAMQAIMTGAFKDPNLQMQQTPDKFDVSADGTMGYVEGRYSETFSNPKSKGVTTVRGYYLTVYRKQADGSWKVVQDVGSPSPGA